MHPRVPGASGDGHSAPIHDLLALFRQDTAAVLRTLHGLRSLASAPALVGTIVSLHERLGDADGATAALEAALADADAKCAAGGSADTSEQALLRAAAAFYARHGRWEAAAAAHRRLLAKSPRDAATLAALVVAESHFDSEQVGDAFTHRCASYRGLRRHTHVHTPLQAHESLARLEMMCPPLDDEPDASIDAEALEQAALPKQVCGHAPPARRVVWLGSGEAHLTRTA